MSNNKFHGFRSAANLSSFAWAVALMCLLSGGIAVLRGINFSLSDGDGTAAAINLAVGFGIIIIGLVFASLLTGFSALIQNSGRIRQLLEQQAENDQA